MRLQIEGGQLRRERDVLWGRVCSVRVDLERGRFCGGVCDVCGYRGKILWGHVCSVRVDLERGRHLVNQIYKVSSVFVLG